MNQSQNFVNTDNKINPLQNQISQNENVTPNGETKIENNIEQKEKKENLNTNDSKENKEQNIIQEKMNLIKEQEMNSENKETNLDTDANIDVPNEEKKEELKEEEKEETKEEKKGLNAIKAQIENSNQNKEEKQNNINKVKSNIKKEISIIHSIQNYIIRNSFQKLVKVALQIDEADFDENIKNEKFLKFVRDKLGLDKFLALMIKSQRGLQKFFIKTRKPKRDPHKSNLMYMNRLNNINNSMSMDVNSNMSNTYTYSSMTNTNYSSNMTNGLSSMNNTYNLFSKDNSFAKENGIKYKPMEQKSEDLTNEISNLMNANNSKKTPEGNSDNTANINGVNPANENSKNSKNATPKKTKYKTKDKDDEEMRLKLAQKLQASESNNNMGGNRFNSPMNVAGFNQNLGLSVHLHKDERKNIFKYYMHHYGQDGIAAFYCSDKRCTGSAKYNIDSKKFEIASEHSIPYNQHCYIFRPFPNDQRLFKEFEKRSFTEAQLFKQPNGRSNIYWYNN